MQGKRNDLVARVIVARSNDAALRRQSNAAGGLQGLRGELQTGKPAKYGAALFKEGL